MKDYYLICEEYEVKTLACKNYPRKDNVLTENIALMLSEHGSTYSCSLRLIDDGALDVRERAGDVYFYYKTIGDEE